MPDSREYRDALGILPTGVTIVTVMQDGAALGMTVNSFTSVSLQPQLILWSVGKDSERHAIFAGAERFAVNILAADQAALARACADEARLDKLDLAWTPGDHGAPLITGALAHLQCRRYAVHPGGDHDILVGEVLDFDVARDAPALVFHRSRYGASG